MGVVGLDTPFNDDTTNFMNVKKKTVVKDTLAGKKDSSSPSKAPEQESKSQPTNTQQNRQPQQKQQKQ